MEKTEEKKLEIVFLPYKASMWDSLESIWQEAKNDPTCNVVVIPVPYHNVESSGKSGKFVRTELICEYDQFPDYVELTHYEDYNISEKKPDIIYTHNPYDDKQVNQMHSDYFSYNLKEHTKMLVYVPYGALGTKLLEKVASRPNTAHVNKIISRSEDVTQAYIEAGVDADKIFTIGTPKIDKVVNTKRENLQLPEEWKNIIGNKKVILYNLHLDRMRGPQDNVFWHKDKTVDINVKNKELINRLKYICNFFKNRDDVVIWWRPHPILIAMIKAFNPTLLKKYLKVVKLFKEKQIGIFDETSDMHRALAFADAYYGDDSSSLIHLFAVTGKPILVQSLEVNNCNDFSIGVYPDLTYENKAVTLKYFTDAIVSSEANLSAAKKKELNKYLREKFITINGNCGKEIHKYIKKALEKSNKKDSASSQENSVKSGETTVNIK